MRGWRVPWAIAFDGPLFAIAINELIAIMLVFPEDTSSENCLVVCYDTNDRNTWVS